MLNAEQFLALGFDPAQIFTALGYEADPWQAELLRSNHPRIILNCCRQAGKSTTVSALCLHTALFKPNSLIILLSRAQRQASELFRKVQEFYSAVGRQIRPQRCLAGVGKQHPPEGIPWQPTSIMPLEEYEKALLKDRNGVIIT
jgi:hypothetical protein